MVKVSDALDCADRAPLDEKFNRLHRSVERRLHASKRCGVVFGEGLPALDASQALKSVSVFAEFLAADVALVTGHFGLPFPRSKPIIFLESALRLAPRADLAPPLVLKT